MFQSLLSLWLFERGLALCVAAALVSHLLQLKGLIGDEGITPASSFMDKLRRNYPASRSRWEGVHAYPTLFWWLPSTTRWTQGVALVSLLAAAAAFFDVLNPALMLVVAAIGYQSLKVVSQPWLGLQMHATVIETVFAYALCAPFRNTIPGLAVFAVRFLVWRIMLGCGACKYGTGEPTWRDLTAMNYHYWTQPLPNPLSWYIHKMPDWFHRLSVVGTHVVEGPLTFLVWGGRYARTLAFAGFVGLNLFINVTGNYGFLGLLTSVQCLPLLDDEQYVQLFDWTVGRLVGPFDLGAFQLRQLGLVSWAEYTPPPLWLYVVAAAVVAPYLAVSMVPLISTFHGEVPWLSELSDWLSARHPRMALAVAAWQRWVDWLTDLVSGSPLAARCRRWYARCFDCYRFVSPFNIVNRYAKFGTMSHDRWEIIVQGSNDGVTWQDYEMKYKPDRPTKRPAVVPFHLPGLDWRIWFLPSDFRRRQPPPRWFAAFLDALLDAKADVLSLLSRNPFPDAPPKYVRAAVYDYTFSYDDPAAWWRRKYIGVFVDARSASRRPAKPTKSE